MATLTLTLIEKEIFQIVEVIPQFKLRLLYLEGDNYKNTCHTKRYNDNLILGEKDSKDFWFLINNF